MKTKDSETQLKKAVDVMVAVMLSAKSRHNGVCMFDSGDSHPDDDI